MEESLKILHLEDEAQMTDLVHTILNSDGLCCEMHRVESREEFISELENGDYDLFLVDYSLPSFDGFSALEIACQKKPDTPFILFTGSLGEERAIESIQKGATDYVLKQNVNRLLPAVKRALDESKQRMERQKAERALAREKHLLDTLMDNVTDNIYFKDLESRFIRINQAQCKFLKLDTPDQAVGKTDFDFFTEDHARQAFKDEKRIIEAGGLVKKEEKIIRKDGQENWFSVVKMPLRDENKNVIGTFGISRNITEQKIAEQELCESEEKFRSVTQSAHDAIVSSDSKGAIVSWNKGAEKLFGYSEKDVLGNDLELIIPEKYYEQHKLGMDRLQTGGEMHLEGQTVELEALHKDGKEFPIELSLAKWKSSKGLFFTAIIRDITERKQAENELRESETFLRTLINAIPIPVFYKERDGRYQGCNKAFESFFGIPEQELIGKTVFDINPPELAKIYHKKDNELYESGGIQQYESQVKNNNGVLNNVIFNKAILNDSNGAVTGLIGTILDLTEQKAAEQAIRQAHKESEKLLSAISLVLIGVDEQDKVTRWNSAAEQIFGIKSEDVLEKSFLDCGIQWNWEEILPQIGIHKNANEPAKWEDIRYNRADGKEGFLSITVNPLHNEDKEYTGFLLIANEITERKHLEAQLTQAQKLESIGQLAAGIAHEINTPVQYIGDNNRFMQETFRDLHQLFEKYGTLLTTNRNGKPDNAELINEIETLTQEIDLPFLLEEIPSALQQSLEGVDRVTNIVRAMKEFSHPGKHEKILTDLNRALENTITVTRNEWKYVADIETDFDTNLPLVPCLPGELNQVFLNLIVNGAQAIGEKQQEGDAEKGKILISTRKDKNWVEVNIQDNGPGIPQSIQNKIFDPFFTTKEVGKGTGQGLAITHNVVVEKHDGVLKFDSEEGKGTKFIIRLPLK